MKMLMVMDSEMAKTVKAQQALQAQLVLQAQQALQVLHVLQAQLAQ